MFKPPKHVTGRALEEWKRLLPYMKENEFDKEQYIMTFAAYCIAVDHFERSVAEINQEGLTVQGRGADTRIKNPAFTTLNHATEEIARGSRAFGFTPGDMKKLNADMNKEEIPSWAQGLL